MHIMVFFGDKLINIAKILFFYVEAICNLAIEFNGLVSIKGQQKCRPFYF